MWEWTKLAYSSTSVFKTATVFFMGEYGFSALLSSLQSAIYKDASLQVTTHNESLAIQPIRCRVWHSENLQILCHRSYMCTSLDHELWTTWVGFCACPFAIKSCPSCVYVGHNACDEMYQALSLLSGENLQMSLGQCMMKKNLTFILRIGVRVNKNWHQCTPNRKKISLRLSFRYCAISLPVWQLCQPIYSWNCKAAAAGSGS